MIHASVNIQKAELDITKRTGNMKERNDPAAHCIPLKDNPTM